MTPIPVQERLIEANDRAAIYALFAHAFAYPDAERVSALHEAALDVLTIGGPLPLIRLAALARDAPR